MISRYRFKWMPSSQLGDSLAEECAQLFSNHYAIWADDISDEKKAGKRVRASTKRWKASYLPTENDYIGIVFGKHTLADTDNNNMTNDSRSDAAIVVGLVTFRRFKWEKQECVWISQLVVDSNHRNKGIAKKLITGCLPCNYLCIASSNPYGILGASTVTGQKIDPKVTFPVIQQLIKHCGIFYISNLSKDDIKCDRNVSVLNTDFDICRSEVDTIIDQQIKNGRWTLGTLPRGHEYVAVFHVCGWKSYSFWKKSILAMVGTGVVLLTAHTVQTLYSRATFKQN